MINKVFSFLLILIVLFTSCEKETRNLQEIQDATIQEYLSKNNLSSRFKKDATGIYYEIIKEGGDRIDRSDPVYYLQEIKALGGNQIPAFNGLVTFSDTYSYSSNLFGYIKPPGFKTSLDTARFGGIVRAIIPSYLAYGKDGIGTQIKGNQILDVTFEVINSKVQAAVEDSLITKYKKTLPDTYVKDEASGVYYHIISPGTGTEEVTLASKIKATYTGKLFNGTQFDAAGAESPMEITLSSLIEGWQAGLPKIKKGGKIKLLIPSTKAYKSTGSGSIPPNTPLFFEIELLDVTN